LRKTPAEFLGYVDAPDEASAVKKAIEEFQIANPWHQKKLVAQKRG